MIKEYADRIREEIKKVETKQDSLRNSINMGFFNDVIPEINELELYKDGLNDALNIYLDLVKEDL